MALAMVLEGLRSAAVRYRRLAKVTMAVRRLSVAGKDSRERTFRVDLAISVDVGSYLRLEWPTGCGTAERLVVLRRPATGAVIAETGKSRMVRGRLRAPLALNEVDVLARARARAFVTDAGRAQLAD